jgi:hypothetical protein
VEPIVIPDATREPAAYVQALLATLGERDPIEVYAGTTQVIREVCAGLDDAGWRVPLAPGEWDAYRVVGHIFDVDIVYGFRWRLALTEENPAYPGYDEKGWSTLARPEPAVLVESLAGIREANVALLLSLTPDDLRRIAVHGEQGEEDVERMMSKVAGHDLAHLNQLQRTVLAARSS